MGVTKKPVLVASERFSQVVGLASKAALVDALWCACQLGTDESEEQILAQAARNLRIALHLRGDRAPATVEAAADTPIDSD